MLGDGDGGEEEGEGEDLFGDNFERCVRKEKGRERGRIKEREKGRKRKGCVYILYVRGQKTEVYIV